MYIGCVGQTSNVKRQNVNPPRKKMTAFYVTMFWKTLLWWLYDSLAFIARIPDIMNWPRSPCSSYSLLASFIGFEFTHPTPPTTIRPSSNLTSLLPVPTLINLNGSWKDGSNNPVSCTTVSFSVLNKMCYYYFHPELGYVR